VKTTPVSNNPRLGYVVSRFPKLSETFILREMDELERLGWSIDVLPFIRVSESVRHPEVERWLARLPAPPARLALLTANLAWLAEAPARLLGLYALVTRRLWSHPGDLARGLFAVARGAFWARQARRTGIAHVHAHFALHPTVAALTISHLADIPFSFTCHAHDVYLRRAMLGEKAHRARFVVAISTLLRDRYLAPCLAPADMSRVHIVRCGVDTKSYARRAEPDPAQPLNILAVARLTPMKGLEHLIDACATLHARKISFQCRIIGEGPLRPALRARIVAAGLEGCVTLLGARSQADVLDALHAATIFAQPSVVTAEGQMEGIPVSVMEAMAVGVPVVATRSGAIDEIIEDGHTGLLVEPGDSGALATAIATLAIDPTLRRRLAGEARRRVERDYDLATNVAMLDRLFRESTAPAPRIPPAIESMRTRPDGPAPVLSSTGNPDERYP
jgi:colanic acid/amylovoran biosynthesis glycosyltransferase